MVLNKVLGAILTKETSDSLADVLKIATVLTAIISPILHFFTKRLAKETNRVGVHVSYRLELHEHVLRATIQSLSETAPLGSEAVLTERMKDLERFIANHHNDFGG